MHFWSERDNKGIYDSKERERERERDDDDDDDDDVV